MAVHFFAVVRQGIAASPRRKPLAATIEGESRRDAYQREYAAEKAAGRPFWHALMKDAIVSIVLLGSIFVLTIALGAPLDPKANPNATGYAPRPEWYFLSLFQLLWYVKGPFESLLIFGIFVIGGLVFTAVPFIDRSRERLPQRRPVAMALAGVVVAGVIGLTVIGATSTPAGVAIVPPVAGMTTQQLEGLKVFNASGCTSCHAVRGIGGTSGPDLSRAGFRWDEATIRTQIVTPRTPICPPSTA